ncbi:MAG: nitric oxide reductase transcriptional regulator NorR [Oceanospirillales bacterium]|nr:nitric oxide reductase transcriptional regulator NorR [Oceanospirillales bacterium]
MADRYPGIELSQSALLQFAIDLADSLSAHDRFDRLLNAVRASIPCDAVVLLQRSGHELKPLAQKGLGADAMGRRFEIGSHPRFDLICRSATPVRFEQDCGLPDPYDGMLQGYTGDLPVHACMGLPLLADQQLIGILTLDSMTPDAFTQIPDSALNVISSMAAASLKTAMLLQHLEDDTAHSRNVIQELTQLALTKDGGELIGESPVMQSLKRELALVAPSDFAILIEGETGVGKELVARTLHGLSQRSKGPLVYVNCAAIPENLVESELFGHVKGAFTGADSHREGKFSLADGGTLFLDEIGELPLAAQSKLLRALQSQEIQPVGQDQVSNVNVRVLAATNRILQQEVEHKRFRADLYHRLNVYPVTVPPLRERAGDITLLAGYFLELSRRKLGIQQLLLSEQARQILQNYPWPGNVRELEHVIGRAALIAHAETPRQTDHTTSQPGRITRIEPRHLADIAAGAEYGFSSDSNAPKHSAEATDNAVKDDTALSLKAQVDAFQKQRIIQTLQQTDGNLAAAARRLDMDRANLARLAKRLGIQVVRKVESE